jgi:hypothetical protein
MSSSNDPTRIGVYQPYRDWSEKTLDPERTLIAGHKLCRYLLSCLTDGMVFIKHQLVSFKWVGQPTLVVYVFNPISAIIQIPPNGVPLLLQLTLITFLGQ